MEGLPEISKAKHSPVEASSSRMTTSAPTTISDSGLDLRISHSRPSTASGSYGMMARSPPGSAALSPSPPPGRPISPSNKLRASTGRRSLNYACVSKNELERKEHALNSLRSEVLQMQAQIRELQHCQQDLTLLQRTCSGIAGVLGCSVEGVAADAVKEILLSRINTLSQENQQATQLHGDCKTELERCQGELAAANVRASSLETQVRQAKKTQGQLECDLKQTKEELETLQLTRARTGAVVESLQQQLTQTKGELAKTRKGATTESTQLQTDIGRLKKHLTEKEDIIKRMEAQLSTLEAERDSTVERLAESEAMYTDLCVQLALSLQLSSAGSFDLDHLLSQVSGVVQECEELRLHCETLGSAVKTAELDSKAGRETILRLVSEAKNHEKDAEKHKKDKEEMVKLRAEQKSLLAASNEEKKGLEERLTATKENLVSLQYELQAKEDRLSEACRNLEACHQASNISKSFTESVQSRYDQLIVALGEVISVESSESGILLQAVKMLVQDYDKQSREVKEQQRLLGEKEASIQRVENTSSELRLSLEKERLRVRKLEAEVEALDLVREGLSNDLEKCRGFYKKMAKAVKLESGTAQILSGDFALDAILMRAEQLAKRESDDLLSKQTAVYSLQRKLKACRQTLESKELHHNLLQRKVEGLEERLRTFTHRESEWETTLQKMKKMENRLEQLQGKIDQQRVTILQLESDNSQILGLKETCQELEKKCASLVASKEELTRTCNKQSRQLSETKQKTKQMQNKESQMVEQLTKNIDTLQREAEEVKEKNQKLSVFKTAVQRLLRSLLEKSSGENPSDYDLITSLEKLVGSQQRHRDNAKCLEASLKQLEQGFKISYKETLTLLSSD